MALIHGSRTFRSDDPSPCPHVAPRGTKTAPFLHLSGGTGAPASADRAFFSPFVALNSPPAAGVSLISGSERGCGGGGRQQSFCLLAAGAVLETAAALAAVVVAGEEGLKLSEVSGVASDLVRSEEESAEKEIDEKERMRRAKIALANKGRVPWNKGKNHSPETIARIKETNSIVMKDPKVRAKLRQYSHPHSEETKLKLKMLMRERTQIQRRQMTILEEWKESIAQTARVGSLGDDELQWDSYAILKETLRQEHFEAVKEKQRQRGSVVKVCTLEQRRKISESIKAKWADPVYRQKVSAGLFSFHKNQGHQQQKPRKKKSVKLDHKPHGTLKSSDSTPISTRRTTEIAGEKMPTDQKLLPLTDGLSTTKDDQIKKVGTYNDPLAKEKLERIKQIRARNLKGKVELGEIRMEAAQAHRKQAEPGHIGYEFSFKSKDDGKSIKKEGEGLKDVERSKSEDAERTGQDAAVQARHGAIETAQHVTAEQSWREATDRARREATERARMLMAEAERAAIVAAKALEAAGTRDESVKSSLEQARILLDEASRSIRDVESGNGFL